MLIHTDYIIKNDQYWCEQVSFDEMNSIFILFLGYLKP